MQTPFVIRVLPLFNWTICLFLAATPAQARDDYRSEEMPARPTPAWVRMVDQGERMPKLAGLRTPEGIRVDIVAEEPVLIDPVGMTFDLDGAPYVLEWREATEQVDVTYQVDYQDGTTATVNRKVKNALDQMKRLIDDDDDGVYDRSEVVMNDLEYPSSVMIHDNWFYFPSVGHVIRRHRSDGGTTFDAEEEILRGMCGYHHHQVSGVSLGHAGWMYTTTGDDDNRAEGSDGSRATVLRTGAIFRSLPDGSNVREFARGFRNPYRNVVFDELFNMFHVDNDQEDGSKFQGVRLMHLLEGADYGWRLQMGAKCCRTDFARGAVFGERPGKMPSMLKVGRGAPAGLLIYQQDRFPDFFRGLLIYPDCYRRLVRAYRVRRQGSSFEVTEQFVLMESDDDLFRPIQAVAGPDGAIYILDWRTDSGGAGKSWGDGRHGRLYRLSWSGTNASPAIPLGSRKAWAGLDRNDSDALFALLSHEDFELRVRAQRELVRRGSSLTPKWTMSVVDTALPETTRVLALGGLANFYTPSVQTLLVELMQSDPSSSIRRLAAEALGHRAVASTVNESLVQALLDVAEKDSVPFVRRSAALAVGRITSVDTVPNSSKQEAADRLFQQFKMTSADDVWLRDGYIRALERSGPVGIERVIAAARSASAEDREQAVGILEACRERVVEHGLDALLVDDSSRLNADQLRRIMESYRNIQVDPPVAGQGLQSWITRHPDAPAELRVAALETLGMIGGVSSAFAEAFAIRLCNDDDDRIRLAAIRAIGNLRMIGATKELVKALAEPHRPRGEQRAVVQSLAMLQAEDWPFVDRSDQGVELVIDDLVTILRDGQASSVQSELLALVAQVDMEKARAPAHQLLASKDVNSMAIAIDILASDRNAALAIARRFLDGELPISLKPNVAAALQRHSPRDSTGLFARLSAELFRDGLTVSLDPAEVDRIEQLVQTTGDAKRGKALFLDSEKTQCIKCHRLEGLGQELGPDLTRIWDTHSVAKLLESMVDPSREIKEGYAMWSLETVAGQVFAGLKVREDSREVTLRDANARDIRVPQAQIASLTETRSSLMPEGLIHSLKFNELIDLLAFLQSREEQQAVVNAESAEIAEP